MTAPTTARDLRTSLRAGDSDSPDDGADQAMIALPAQEVPPAGDRSRYGRRWRLVGAGLGNVWRFADLQLAAHSGRLLLRGANGTGKTTALEALCPYLLDLNAQKMAAGKARPTTLGLLMKEGSNGQKRTGYAWLTFAAPAGHHDSLTDTPSPATRSWGVRLQYGPGSTPQVKAFAFTVPGQPSTDFDLHWPGRQALTLEQFIATVEAAGGHVFDSHEDYVTDLAATVWRGSADDVQRMTARMREVRNPTLLGDVGPSAAAEALRSSLPTVDQQTVTATAAALAASDETREAFERDKANAATLSDFSTAWAGHAVQVVTQLHSTAHDDQRALRRARGAMLDSTRQLERAEHDQQDLATKYQNADLELNEVRGTITALTRSSEYAAANQAEQQRRVLVATNRYAVTAEQALSHRANEVRKAGQRRTQALTQLVAEFDLVAGRAAAADPSAQITTPLMTWHQEPRGVHQVGVASVDPGPAVAVEQDRGAINTTVTRWRRSAGEHATTANTIGLLVSQHDKHVKPAAEEASGAQSLSQRAAAEAERRSQLSAQRDRAARAEVRTVANSAQEWARQHPELRAVTVDGADPNHTDDAISWDADAAQELADAEPQQVLTFLTTCAAQATATAGTLAVAAHTAAAGAQTRADQAADEASDLRHQASILRSGKDLPMPRPAWAPTLDDESRTVGAGLVWADDFTDPTQQAQLEVALADSGLLGVTTDPDGLTAGTWQVHADGPPVASPAASVLRADPDHPGAAVIATALHRISLHDTAPDSCDGLGVARDGSYTAGVLRGDRLHAADGRQAAPAATHVGQTQRRLAALARAAELEQGADELDIEAARAREIAHSETALAASLIRAASNFPSTRKLQQLEASRVSEALAAHAAAEEARAAQAEATAKAESAKAEHRRWAGSVTALELKPDRDGLVTQEQRHTTASSGLLHAASDLEQLVVRVQQVREEVNGADDDLTGLVADARTALNEAAAIESEIAAIEEALGSSAQEVLDQLTHAESSRELLGKEIKRLFVLLQGAATNVGDRRTAHTSALAVVTGAQSAGTASSATLRTSLNARGVLEALGGQAALPAEDRDLIAVVSGLIDNRASVGRRTLGDRYDTARAQLAGAWSVEHDEYIGELETFVLTHDDETFTPVSAAAHAQHLADKAEEALRAADDAALRTFIVDQLPRAITLAWTNLQDWKREVNRKMTSAESSSGVGVQVEITPVDDMSRDVRTVYELACKVGAAQRTREQHNQLGAAIRSLIETAHGETMVDQVSAAVDVRDWVDVRYRVTRPGQPPQLWTSRTGLSGGERRLVVLAPMLAAVAAGYDDLASEGLRLVALDEVPAEVDEVGREGLARYIAELDLDLICTSYLWDGAPGAWDGVDAWDFEADAGVVVAFPMHVRSDGGLPGEPAPLHPHQASHQAAQK